MARELKQVVVIGGAVYGPGYINPPPDDVAQTITNAAAWGEAKESSDSEVSPSGEETPVEAPVVADPGDGTVTVPEGQESPATPVVSEPPKPSIPVPPRSGAGSGRDAWRAFADANDVTYGPDDSRDDIVEACEKAKVI